MTQEQKAQAYDEALKRAKTAIDMAADKDLVGGVVRTILPELRESEDERIRKSLVDYFGRYNPENKWDDEFSFKEVLAYLEKQKEQKQEWSEKEKENLDKCCAIIAQPDTFFDPYFRQKCLDFLFEISKKFSLQPKQEWNEDYRNE